MDGIHEGLKVNQKSCDSWNYILTFTMGEKISLRLNFSTHAQLNSTHIVAIGLFVYTLLKIDQTFLPLIFVFNFNFFLLLSQLHCFYMILLVMKNYLQRYLSRKASDSFKTIIYCQSAKG